MLCLVFDLLSVVCLLDPKSYLVALGADVSNCFPWM